MTGVINVTAKLRFGWGVRSTMVRSMSATRPSKAMPAESANLAAVTHCCAARLKQVHSYNGKHAHLCNSDKSCFCVWSTS